MISAVDSDKKIYRGPEPLCGDYGKLRELGVQYTLDLESGSKLMFDGDPLDEAMRADNYGIRIYSHPLGEFFPPTKYELKRACDLITQRHKIYIHCKSGVDRTGMVIAYYRIYVDGWAREVAIDEMKKMGMHPWYFYWIWTL